MARGTVVGEPVVSQAATDEYRSEHERIFGERKSGQRGTWVWDAQAGKLVCAEDYVPPAVKAGTTICSGRWHEGQKAPDGSDIGTPGKRRAWMKATGTADYDDYKGVRAAKRKELAERSESLRTGKFKPDKELRNLIGRELYKQKVIL